MIQLQVITGRRAGAVVPVGKFPFLIGRAAGSALALDDPGVWEQHLQLDVDPAQGFALQLLPPAIATVNGHPFDRVLLRNGDLIEAGQAQLRFWLAPTRQSGQRLRETLTWLALGGLCAGQLAIIYALLG